MNRYKNKVIYGGQTLIDLTQDTATESDVVKGKTFHKADGSQAVGTFVGGGYDYEYEYGTIPSGDITVEQLNVTQNGTYTAPSGKAYSPVVVNVSASGKNVQVATGMKSVRTTSLTATGLKLTVAKSGTYQISWMGARNNSSNTFGSRLYKNGTAQGSETTTFTNTYAQNVSMTLALNEGDEIEVYARARSTSYYMMVGNLVITEV